mgnify:CR=1 FL=1
MAFELVWLENPLKAEEAIPGPDSILFAVKLFNGLLSLPLADAAEVILILFWDTN